jgi:hypothetical protein
MNGGDGDQCACDVTNRILLTGGLRFLNLLALLKFGDPPLLMGKICGPRILKESTVLNIWRNISGIAIRVLC